MKHFSAPSARLRTGDRRHILWEIHRAQGALRARSSFATWHRTPATTLDRGGVSESQPSWSCVTTWPKMRSNLRRIPPPKSERVRRAWIPTPSLINSCSAAFRPTTTPTQAGIRSEKIPVSPSWRGCRRIREACVNFPSRTRSRLAQVSCSRMEVAFLADSLAVYQAFDVCPRRASQAQISQLINIPGNVMVGPIGTSIGPTVWKPAAR
jgi:hypothetical protein